LAAFHSQVNSVILAKEMFEKTRKTKIMGWQGEFNRSKLDYMIIEAIYKSYIH